MSNRGKKLNDALHSAEKMLLDSDYKNVKFSNPTPRNENGDTKPLSKLNSLLGNQSYKTQRPSLFSRQGVSQRPTYDTISKDVLGSIDEYKNPFLSKNQHSSEEFSVSKRLNEMRKSRLHSIEKATAESQSDYVGLDQFGTPLWMNVLQEQRSMAIHQLPSELKRQDAFVSKKSIQFQWPRKLQWSEHHSFRQWFVCKENIEATRLIETVIDSPSRVMNPLSIVGGEQSGTTFLMRASGQALLRRQEGHVLWFNALDLEHVSPTSIEDALDGCCAIIVDDIEQFAVHEQWKLRMGEWFEHSLQSSVQILASSKIPIEELPSSKMRRFLLDGIQTQITSPSESTLVQYAKWYAIQRNMMLDEIEFVELVRNSQHSWRSIRNKLEEVIHLNQGPGREYSGIHPEFENDVITTANEIISKAMDAVHTDIDMGGVELHSKIVGFEEDDYQPPDFDDIISLDMPLSKVQHEASSFVEKIMPTQPSVLDIHDEDKFIVSKDKFDHRGDMFKTADMLVDIEKRVDDSFSHRLSSLQEERQLSQIGLTMEELSSRIQHADIEELIAIADQLQTIDEQLQSIQSPTTSTQSALDSYEPEGEWFIDEGNVELNELDEIPAHQEPQKKNKVHLSRMKKNRVLTPMHGEEE
ncbi:MAG: DnaA/Hda family protein [Candidatus Poseidoniales archaeon]